MMRWIVRSSLTYRLLIVPIAAAAMFVGIVQLRGAPVDALPEFAPPYVEIQTEALGLSASEVEQLITAPLEADLLNQVAWIDQIRSESVPGLSSIELIFEPGTDILDARQMVQERLIQAGDMPNVSKPPNILQPLSSSNRVMMVGLSSADVSLIEMSVLARWKIKPRLLGVPGVANVAIWGQRERQLQVHVDPERLRQHGVPLSQVIRTTGNALWVSPLSFLQASTPGSGGFVESPSQRFGVQHVSPITTPQSLAQVTIEDPSGRTLRLGDVADVVEDHQPLIGDAIVNDGPSLMLVIEKFPGFNTVDVTKGVEEALAALQPGLTGVEMDTTLYRPATFIESALDNVGLALLIGLILVVVVIGVVLFDWRVGLIGLLAIPLSLVVAAFVLYLRGVSFNLVTLAGFVIALGAIVDDAVVDVDNIKRRLREAPGGASAAAVVLKASLEMRGTIVYATLIMLATVVPFFFLGGTTGAFLGPLGLAYVLAIVASILVALTVTPALALLLLSRGPLNRRDAPAVRWLHSGQNVLLSRFLGRRLWAYLAMGVVVLAGLAALPAMLAGKPMLPTLQDRTLLVQWAATPGTSRQAINRVTERASVELRALPGVRNVGAHVGRAVSSDQVVNINSGQLWVSIDPAADYDATVASVRRVVDGYAGLSSEVLTYPEARIREVEADANRPLVVRVYGQNQTVLNEKADEIQQLLTKVRGVVEPRVDRAAEEPTVEVEVNLDAAQRHGVKPGDVRRAAATLLSGVEVGSLFEEQKVFDVVVWGAPATRRSPTDIRELLVDTPSGGHVRLGDVAEVRIRAHPVVIKRDSVSRRIDVVADVRGRDLGSVVRDVESRLKSVSFPVETHAEVLGRYTQRQGDQRRALILGLAAMIGIFLLLQAAMGSWRLAFILFPMLPLAAAGGALAAWVAGSVTSLGSLVGLLAVIGIAARAGLLLIRHYQSLERDGEAFGPDLVLRGTRERLTPTVLGTVATALLLIPFLVMGAVPGHELVYPLAIVILGGLVASLLLNLFVVPALYLRFAPSTSGAPNAPSATASKGDTDAAR